MATLAVIAASSPVLAANVTGANSNPVFRELGAFGKEAPRWNFHKYFVDRSGTRVVTFESMVTPDDPRLAEQIGRMLKG